MKVTDITTVLLDTGTHPTALLQEGWLVVRVHTDEGIVGLGEATHGGNALVRTYLERQIKPWLIGRDPTHIEPYATEWLARARGHAPATAVSGVEQALWDIWGQSLGRPIWALLGGRHRSSVPLYANINRATFDRSPAAHAESARGAVRAGFGAVKCAPFDDVQYRFPDRATNLAGIRRGIERVAAVREAVGPDVRVMVDCHSRFDVPTAIQVARELEPLRLAWLEEPVPCTDLEGLERVREHATMPIAGAESLVGRVGYWETIRRRVLDVIMPDVKHCGGVLELRKIAAVAESCHTAVSPHNPSGPISTLMSVHVCASIPNLLALEYPWGEATWRRDLVRPTEIADGAIVVPDSPGLGFTLDDEVAAAHRMPEA